MQKFKLAIGNQVGVTVEATYRDEVGADRTTKFVLQCVRMSADELRTVIADKQETVEDFLLKNVLGWREQSLVLDGADQPVPFSADALKVLLSIQGMAGTCWRAYLKQVTVAEKN